MAQELEFKVIGKVIGTGNGWDQSDDWACIIYNICFNELGAKFVRLDSIRSQIPQDRMIDISINYDTGEVELYIDCPDEDAEQAVINVTPDWSVFND